MKKLLALLLMFINLDSVYAVSWNKDTKKAFKTEKVFNLIVDFSRTKFSGLDSLDFVTYYSNKEGKEKDYFAIVLKKIKNTIKESMEKSSKKHFLLNEALIPKSFTYKYQFLTISEKGGLSGVLYIYPNFSEESSIIYDFTVKDGRWNSFENLLYEAAEKLCHNCIGFESYDQVMYKAIYKKRKM